MNKLREDATLVWSDEKGDLRKNKNEESSSPVDESILLLKVRRITSGKGRTIIEIADLPPNKSWCQKLAKDLKKKLGVGGAYKKTFIEIHGEKLEAVTTELENKKLKWKKIGG